MHLFNPENDLALANFNPNYTPPASAIRMAQELAILPIWYAGKDNVRSHKNTLIIGDGKNNDNQHDLEYQNFNSVDEGEMVIAEGSVNRLFLEEIKNILPIQAILIPFSDVALYPHREIVPWGWNPALRKKLLSCGVSEDVIPSPSELGCLRDYSNRRHSVEVLRELQTEEDQYCGESHYFTDEVKLFSYLQSFTGNKVLKMPLSGSGKGLIWILGEITEKQCDWCRKVIKEQGGVVAEPVLKKVQDFALEFYLNNGVASFFGYSMFSAAASGAYMGNDLISDERIEERLSTFVPITIIHQLRNLLIEKLSQRFPLYTGYVGVDMMVCESLDGYHVQPCVEINMRMNMGVVARIFHTRYIDPGKEGKFIVDYCKKPEGARDFHQKMKQESPLIVENGKIISGYLSLTPVSNETHYLVYIVMG